MSLPPFDFFDSWRWLLATVCSVYAIVVTARSLWGWIEYFAAPDRTTALMRRYTIVHLLRLRVRPFLGEVGQIVFWTLALVILVYLHSF
jgi:hypothetical protein